MTKRNRKGLQTISEWTRLAAIWVNTKDAANTKHEYMHVLRDLESAFGDFDITAAKLGEYKALLMQGVEEGALKITTVAHRVTILKGFLKFAREAGAHGLTDTALDMLLKRPRTQYQPPVVEPSEYELERVLDACASDRDRLIVLLANETGMRREELCNIHMDQFVVQDGHPVISIDGKGRKKRTVPLSPKAIEAITIFATRNDIPANKHVPLFRGRGGKPIEKSTAGKAMRMARQRAGVRSTITLHKFRHKAAIDILRGSNDVNAVRAMMGHDSLNTTTRYVDHLKTKDLVAAMAARKSAG